MFPPRHRSNFEKRILAANAVMAKNLARLEHLKALGMAADSMLAKIERKRAKKALKE